MTEYADAERCLGSIEGVDPGPFAAVGLQVYDDRARKGWAVAKDTLVRRSSADWVLLLGGQDRLLPSGLREVKTEWLEGLDALWPSIVVEGKGEHGYRRGQIWPFTEEELMRGDPYYGLGRSFFARRELLSSGAWPEDEAELYLSMWRKARCAKVEAAIVVLGPDGPQSPGCVRERVALARKKALSGV